MLPHMTPIAPHTVPTIPCTASTIPCTTSTIMPSISPVVPRTMPLYRHSTLTAHKDDNTYQHHQQQAYLNATTGALIGTTDIRLFTKHISGHKRGSVTKGIGHKGISHKGIILKGISHKGISHKGISHKGISHKGNQPRRSLMSQRSRMAQRGIVDSEEVEEVLAKDGLGHLCHKDEGNGHGDDPAQQEDVDAEEGETDRATIG